MVMYNVKYKFLLLIVKETIRNMKHVWKIKHNSQHSDIQYLDIYNIEKAIIIL